MKGFIEGWKLIFRDIAKPFKRSKETTTIVEHDTPRAHLKVAPVITLTATVSVHRGSQSPVDILGSRIASKMLEMGLAKVTKQNIDTANLEEMDMTEYTIEVEVVMPKKK